MFDLLFPNYSSIKELGITPMKERKVLRYSYWNSKYSDPDWAEDIHFALFAGDEVSIEEFKRGVVLNTLELLQEIFDRASVYRLSLEEGPRVLDYGCGAGDFLIALADALPEMRGTGL